MKPDERELREVERLTLACQQASGSRSGEGSRGRPLSLSALLEQRRRALEGRLG